jgi:hypothetical protein
MSVDSQLHAVINPELAGGMSNSDNNLIVMNHLMQMKMFGIRQGVELYPEQDDNDGTRKSFIEQVWDYNELDVYQDRIWDLALCTGQLLCYYRPNTDGLYTLSFFPKDDFKVEYTADNKIEMAMIRYWYYETGTINNVRQKRWIRLVLTKDRIYQENYGTGIIPGWDLAFGGINMKEMENTLGFVPCRVIRVNALGPGRNGVGEFEFLRAQIEDHAENVAAIRENLQFFGNPILMATRSPSELVELASLKSPNLSRAHTITMESGWGAPELNMGSTGKSPPRHLQMGENLRIKKVVGNVQNDERFGFVSPPPIATEQRRHVVETREALHFALGGIDETGIHASATAYEMKVVYGKVATTALKKAKAIYSYGLCKVFEDLIAAEESLFQKTFAAAVEVMPEEVTQQSLAVWFEAHPDMPLPDGVYGLPPIGRRKVAWRWTGPVFEDSPDDMQRRSIVVRNLQELGVRSIDALNVLFPDKTQREKEGMLSGGYPFRYLNAVAGTTGQMLGLYQQMMSLPSQENPDIPLIASIPLEPMITRSAEVIFNELNYRKPTDPTSAGESPYVTGVNAYDQWLRTLGKLQYQYAAAAGQPVQLPPELAGATNPLGYGGASAIPGQSASATGISTYTGGSTAGLQQSLFDTSGSTGSGFVPIPPEYVKPLPQPGSTTGTSAARLPKSPTGAELYAQSQSTQPPAPEPEPASKPKPKSKSKSKPVSKSKPKPKS